MILNVSPPIVKKIQYKFDRNLRGEQVGGRVRYTPEQVKEYQFIVDCRNVGLSYQDIQELTFNYGNGRKVLIEKTVQQIKNFSHIIKRWQIG